MRIIRLGVPSGITQAIFSMTGMVVQTLTNSMGEMVIAANVIIMRVDGFAMMPNFSFGQAMSVYTGQNVGAAKYDRVGLGTKQGTIIAVSCSAVITCVLLFLNKFLFGIFTDTAELIDLAGRMMRLMAVGYLGVAITQSLGGVMRGAGDTVSPMWISIISTVFLRVPIAYIMAHFTASEAWPQGHPFSLSASLLISWVLGAVMSCVVFKLGKWKKTMKAFHEP
jgi:Na+-driven multidrug efflux pump